MNNETINNRERIIVSVVCYNNEKEIVDFCNSCLCSNNSIIVLVSINSSSRREWLESELEKYNDRVRLFDTQTNRGYLHGCMFGINKFYDISDDDWIIISNTDVKFNVNELVEGVKRWHNYKDEIACIAPSIQLTNGQYQNPFLIKRIKRKKVSLLRFTHSNLLLFWCHSKASDIRKNKGDAPISDGDIYAPHGSFFILTPYFYKQLVSNEDSIFMYGEELLIGELALEFGLRIVYDNSIHILHMENATTGLIGNGKKIEWYTQSYSYLLNRFKFD